MQYEKRRLKNMITKFTEKFKDKTDIELSEYIDNKKSYQKDAILTAIIELENRGQSSEKNVSLKNQLLIELEIEKKQKIRTSESKIPAGLPKAISNSAKLIYVSVILGIINPIITELTTDIQNFSNPTNLVIILVSTSILAFLAYDISKEKNWARIVFTVLCGIGFLMFPLVLPETFRLNPIVGVFSTIQAILQGIAIILLFKSESRTWYRNSKQNGNNTAHNNA